LRHRIAIGGGERFEKGAPTDVSRSGSLLKDNIVFSIFWALLEFQALAIPRFAG
jgi:hypothetical protein